MLSLFCFALAGSLPAALNANEYRRCIFDLNGNVNSTSVVNFILRDANNLDEHSYQGNYGDNLNWVDVKGIATNSLYSIDDFNFARIKRKINVDVLPECGTLKLKFDNNCTETEHYHPNKTVYCHVLCLYDETGNDISDTALGVVTPQFFWNGFNNDNYTYYSNGILWYTNWHGLAYHDIDVWKLNNLENDKIYCVEVKTLEKSDPHLQLEIIQSGQNSRTLHEQNVFAEDGTKDGKTYRIYFCSKGTDAKVKISFHGSEQHFNTKYKIVLMKCKPVVLVHGLGGYPRYSGGSGTDFGDLRNFIGYVKNIRPCVCLEFPWDPCKDSYKNYVGSKNTKGTLYHYINESNKYFHAKGTLMTYSTGGTILYDQMLRDNLYDVMENAVIIASPFWGVHIAKTSRSRVSHWIGLNYFFGGSYENLTDLSRGSKINWQRYESHSSWSHWSDITIVVGTGIRTTKRYLSFYANHFGHDLNETSDSYRGDGLVGYHSANLKNKHPGVDKVESSLGHDSLTKFYLSDLGERVKYYKKIVDKINTWENSNH